MALTIRRKSISNSWRGEIYLKMVTKYYYLKEEVLKLLLHYGFKSVKVQETRASTRSDWQSATNWSPSPWTITYAKAYWATTALYAAVAAQRCLESFRYLRALSRCTFKCLWMYLHYTNMFGKYMFREESSKTSSCAIPVRMKITESWQWKVVRDAGKNYKAEIWNDRITQGITVDEAHHPLTAAVSVFQICVNFLFTEMIEICRIGMNVYFIMSQYFGPLITSTRRRSIESSPLFRFFARCQRHPCKWVKCNLCLWSGQLLGCQEKTVTTLT